MLFTVDANTPNVVVEQSGKQATQSFWISLRNVCEKDYHEFHTMNFHVQIYFLNLI